MGDEYDYDVDEGYDYDDGWMYVEDEFSLAVSLLRPPRRTAAARTQYAGTSTWTVLAPQSQPDCLSRLQL